MLRDFEFCNVIGEGIMVETSQKQKPKEQEESKENDTGDEEVKE